MNQSKRFSSIARKINRGWLVRLLFIFIGLDLFILLLVAGGFFYYSEVSALGAFSQDTQRWMSVDTTVSGIEWVRALGYSFAADGITETVPLLPLVSVIEVMFQPLLWFQGIIWTFQLLSGSSWVRRLLRPLDKIALTTQRISQAQAIPEARALTVSDPGGFNGINGLNEEKFHNLEDAIQSLAANRPDAKISTGDRDLQGLEEAINDLLSRMHESYRQQARFVSDASHELRTPIAVIQGYAAMLDRWGKNDENVLSESIEAIKQESEHMKKLVEQLLFLARGDSGRQKLSFERVSLTEMIREVYEEYRMIDEAHQWSCKAEDGVYCVGDIDMLKQAARILTDNAVKYTPEGGTIRLRTGYQDGVPFFEVQDSGSGIAQEDIPKIFDRFFRSDPARSSQSGGTGLGLSIAKWIVDRHMGHFNVLSRPDLGTRIAVFFPQTTFSEHRNDLLIPSE